MRFSSIPALGIATFLGIVAVDTPDANAQADRTTVVSSPRGTAVIARRPGRVTVLRGRRGARGAVICRTRIVNGVRVTRCR
jgi:hypothetical protein